MEHTCSQCGTVVEDGRPFCPQCHTPQIKVPVRPPTAPATEPLPPGTPEDLQPPAEPMVEERRPVPVPESLRPIPQDKLIRSAAISSSLVAGALVVCSTFIPVAPLTMLCMFASGGLAVTLYRRRAGYQTVTPWMGAKLGLLAGGFGGGLIAILSTLGLFAASERAQARSVLQGIFLDATGDPRKRQVAEQFQGYIASDNGLVVVMLVLFVVGVMLFLLFSALGGALGAALFGRESGHKES